MTTVENGSIVPLRLIVNNTSIGRPFTTSFESFAETLDESPRSRPVPAGQEFCPTSDVGFYIRISIIL
jgi:hypothetical protein